MKTPTSATGKCPACSQVGFTLVELLVVLTLIAVAATMIVPRMAGSLTRRELREHTARLAYTARTVRELAVAGHRTMAIEFDLNRSGYSVTMPSSEPGSTRWQPVQMSWLKSARWPDTVKLVEFNTPGARARPGSTHRLTFFPDGTSTGATIRLACDMEEYRLMVHAHNGRVVFGNAKTSSFPQYQYDLGD